MAITDIFKKDQASAAKSDFAAKKDKKSADKEPKKSNKISSLMAKTIIHAHVTEKASRLSEKSQYVFRIAPKANKKEVARAIEKHYGVSVVAVAVINLPGKRRRRGRGIAVEPGCRKAVVTLKKGQTIEVLPQ